MGREREASSRRASTELPPTEVSVAACGRGRVGQGSSGGRLPPLLVPAECTLCRVHCLPGPWEPFQRCLRSQASLLPATEPLVGLRVGRLGCCRDTKRRCLWKSAPHWVVGSFRVVGRFMPPSRSLAVPKPGLGALGPLQPNSGLLCSS